jgi:hypothetical protein
MSNIEFNGDGANAYSAWITCCAKQPTHRKRPLVQLQ